MLGMYGDVVCGDSTLLRKAGHMLLPIIPVSTQRISIVYISTSSTKIKISAQDFIAFLPLYSIIKKRKYCRGQITSNIVCDNKCTTNGLVSSINHNKSIKKAEIDFSKVSSPSLAMF